MLRFVRRPVINFVWFTVAFTAYSMKLAAMTANNANESTVSELKQ